jgi:hypothetical protein
MFSEAPPYVPVVLNVYVGERGLPLNRPTTKVPVSR